MKRIREVIKSLPFDCWCEIVLFLGRTQDFQSLLLTVNGLFPYIKQIYPRCTENVVHLIREFPQTPRTHVSSLRFSPNPSLFEFENVENVKEFFSMNESNMNEIEVTDLGSYLNKPSFSSLISTSFEGFFSRMIDNDTFPNLLRLEIEVLELKRLIFPSNNDDFFEVELENPFRDITFENFVSPSSQLRHLKYLKLSLTCRKLTIKQVLNSVEVFHLYRLGSLFEDEENEEEEFISFYEKYDLDVKWKDVFPRLHSLHLRGWIISRSQFVPISSQIENLWLDSVKERVDESNKDTAGIIDNCKSVKLSGDCCSLFRPKFLESGIENLEFNNETHFKNFFEDFCDGFLEDYYESESDSVERRISFSSLKKLSNLRSFHLIAEHDSKSLYSFDDDELLLDRLHQLEFVEIMNVAIHLTIVECRKLEKFVYEMRVSDDDEDEDDDDVNIPSLHLEGAYSSLGCFAAKNVFLDHPTILKLSSAPTLLSLTSLTFGFWTYDYDTFEDISTFLPQRNSNKTSTETKPIKISFQDAPNLEDLKIGYLTFDRTISCVVDCPVLKSLELSSSLELDFKISDLPMLKKARFLVGCFEKFIIDEKSNKNDCVLSQGGTGYHQNVFIFLNELRKINFENLRIPFSPFIICSETNPFSTSLEQLSICFAKEESSDFDTVYFLGKQNVLIGGNVGQQINYLKKIRVSSKRSVHISNITSLEEIILANIKKVTIRNLCQLQNITISNTNKSSIFSGLLSLNHSSKLPLLRKLLLKGVPSVSLNRLESLEKFTWTSRSGYFDLIVKNCQKLKSVQLDWGSGSKTRLKKRVSDFRDSQLILESCQRCDELILKHLPLLLRKRDVFQIRNVPITKLTCKSSGFDYYSKEDPK